LWLSQQKRDGAWLQFLPAERTVYAQINAIRDGSQETLAQFAERMRREVELNDAERLVLDLRFNRGGNGELMRSIVRSVIKADRIDRPGGLYVIIGRSTWSAAQFLVDALEKYASPVFVGEPTGSRGNHFGDSRVFTLPNSRVSVRTSTYYWQDWHPLDRRPWTAPDIPAELTFEDYRAGVDPAMRAIRADTARNASGRRPGAP
jgi:C-terminal processing protease CtpA/Prc